MRVYVSRVRLHGTRRSVFGQAGGRAPGAATRGEQLVHPCALAWRVATKCPLSEYSVRRTALGAPVAAGLADRAEVQVAYDLGAPIRRRAGCGGGIGRGAQAIR